MKILVTGANGFVGSSVSEALSKTKYDVTLGCGREHNDMLDYSAVCTWLDSARADVIIHCAADVGGVHYVTDYAADVVVNNTQMAINLYRAVNFICPQVKIINVLANCMYPGESSLQHESELWNGAVHPSVLSFGNYKRYLSVMSRCYKMQHNIDTINLISPNAYGVGDSLDPNHTHAMNGMIIRMLHARNNGDSSFEIWGTGAPVREWLYVKDLADVLVQSVSIDMVSTSPINIAQGVGYSIKDSAETIADVINYKGDLVFNHKYKDGAPHKEMDDTLFRKIFPSFKFMDYKEGIKETVKYYEERL